MTVILSHHYIRGRIWTVNILVIFPNHYDNLFLCEEVPPKPREEKTRGDVIYVGLYAVELFFLVDSLYATIVHAPTAVVVAVVEWW